MPSRSTSGGGGSSGGATCTTNHHHYNKDHSNQQQQSHHHNNHHQNQQQQQHHHHHRSSYPSPSFSIASSCGSNNHSHSNHHNHHHHHHHHAHNSSCYSTPSSTLLYGGSATLPSTGLSSADRHVTTTGDHPYTSYCRSRTLTHGGIGSCASSTSATHHYCWSHCGCCCDDGHPNLSHRHPIPSRIVFFTGLSLLLVIICSAVITGLLVTHSLREHEEALNNAELFRLHQHVGQFAFELGHEMVFTVNSSIHSFDRCVASLEEKWKPKTSLFNNENGQTKILFNDTNSTEFAVSPFDQAAIRVKRNRTDAIFRQVFDALSAKGYFDFGTGVRAEMTKWRAELSSAMIDTIDTLRKIDVTTKNVTAAIVTARRRLFHVLAECVREFSRRFRTLDSFLLHDSPAVSQWLGERDSKSALIDLSMRNMPFTLFIRGAVHRFAALVFGAILVRDNFSLQSLNMSEYQYHHHASRQLIESSFGWNQRFMQKYLELDDADDADGRDRESEFMSRSYERRRALEHDYYAKMSVIFSHIFTPETVTRLRSYIKKKNVETVERLLVNGSETSFVADADANSISVPLDADLIELFGVANIEDVMFGHQNMLNSSTHGDDAQKYDQLLRDQLGFVSRVRDFLSVSISAHLAKAIQHAQQNLWWHSLVCASLLGSAMFAAIVLLCVRCRCALIVGASGSGCCSGGECCSSSSMRWCSSAHPSSSSTSSSAPGSASKSNFTRRIARHRRRLWWNLSSPFGMLKSCFGFGTGGGGVGGGTVGSLGAPRYPLLYKSSLPPQQQQSQSQSQQLQHQKQKKKHHHHHHHHHASSSRCCAAMMCCASPNIFLGGGGVTARHHQRYHHHGTSPQSDCRKSSCAISYKFDKINRSNHHHHHHHGHISGRGTAVEVSEMTRNLSSSKGRLAAKISSDKSLVQASSSVTTATATTTSVTPKTTTTPVSQSNGDDLDMCCVASCDHNCNELSEAADERCEKCAATGKCATCCPFIRDQDEEDDGDTFSKSRTSRKNDSSLPPTLLKDSTQSLLLLHSLSIESKSESETNCGDDQRDDASTIEIADRKSVNTDETPC